MSHQRVHQLYKGSEYKKIINERLAILKEVRRQRGGFCALCGRNFGLAGHSETMCYIKNGKRYAVRVCGEGCALILKKRRRKKGGIAILQDLFFSVATLEKDKNKKTKKKGGEIK